MSLRHCHYRVQSAYATISFQRSRIPPTGTHSDDHIQFYLLKSPRYGPACQVHRLKKWDTHHQPSKIFHDLQLVSRSSMIYVGNQRSTQHTKVQVPHKDTCHARHITRTRELFEIGLSGNMNGFWPKSLQKYVHFNTPYCSPWFTTPQERRWITNKCKLHTMCTHAPKYYFYAPLHVCMHT